MEKHVICDCRIRIVLFFIFCTENLATLCILKHFGTEAPPKQTQNLNYVPLNTYQHCLVTASFKSGPFITVVELCKDTAGLFFSFSFLILNLHYFIEIKLLFENTGCNTFVLQ